VHNLEKEPGVVHASLRGTGRHLITDPAYRTKGADWRGKCSWEGVRSGTETLKGAAGLVGGRSPMTIVSIARAEISQKKFASKTAKDRGRWKFIGGYVDLGVQRGLGGWQWDTERGGARRVDWDGTVASRPRPLATNRRRSESSALKGLLTLHGVGKEGPDNDRSRRLDLDDKDHEGRPIVRGIGLDIPVTRLLIKKKGGCQRKGRGSQPRGRKLRRMEKPNEASSRRRSLS